MCACFYNKNKPKNNTKKNKNNKQNFIKTNQHTHTQTKPRMGFAVQEKHCSSYGGNIYAKRMVNNIVHSLSAINTTMNGNNVLFQHFRSWQRSRKMKILNQKNSTHSFVGNLSPMNNLCYQSVSIGNDLDSSTIENSTSPKTHYPNNNDPMMMMMKNHQNRSIPIVSFKNKGDGKIMLNMKNHHHHHHPPVMLNDNQLYSMDIGHVDRHRLPVQTSSGSCYVSLEPPIDLYEKNDMVNQDPLNNENWYYGTISREQAIKLIQNCPTGSFVVRKSSSNDGCYALTVRVPYDYNHTGVSHYLILRNGDEIFKIKGFHKEFHSISSLITHHSIMKEQLPCTLRLLVHEYNNQTLLSNNTIKKSKCQSFYSLNSSQIYCKKSWEKQHANTNYNSYNTMHGSTLSCYNNNNDDLMVDVDLDPTYQRILENFRKVMSHCNN